MDYLFHPIKKELRKSPEAIRKGMGFMSSNEQLLANFALDLWGGYGKGIHIDDLICSLDSNTFKRCVNAMIKVKRELYM